jgi:hypothetical protein
MQNTGLLHEENRLYTLIHSWSTSPRIFIPHHDPTIEAERREITNGMYSLAKIMARVLQASNLNELVAAMLPAHGYEAWNDMINSITDDGLDPLESRNGCEPWQAFLTVSHLAQIVGIVFSNQFIPPDADMVFVHRMTHHCNRIRICAKECAISCFRRRIHHAPLHNLQDMHLIIQILEIEEPDSQYARQCLDSAIQLVSTNAITLFDARKILSDHLSYIQRWGFIFSNVHLLERAIADLTTALNERDTIINNHMANLPDDIRRQILRRI